ncbi:MAG: hypothetical protein ACWA5W_10735 [Phycisphaerales bacterium]
MPNQKHPFTQRFTCHACGYDMHDRVKGDLCPECGTELDTRPDLPGSLRGTTLRAYLLIGSILAMPFVAMISILLIAMVIIPSYPQKTVDRYFRISYQVARRRQLIRLLIWISLAELAALVVISEFWPKALNWW